jgi:S-adenosylmethionine:tRNA ribosyltransferase-isomerase
MKLEEIRTDRYAYHLPESRIAQYPLPERDASKLLVFRNGLCSTDNYKNLASYIPAGSLMVFNNSKVIPARLRYVKATSGVIELFCLEPFQRTPYEALQDRHKTEWVCMIGGLKKWRIENELQWTVDSEVGYILKAKYISTHEHGFLIEFSWDHPSHTFAEVLHDLGQMPIPPYLLRQAELSDEQRYQTVYASVEGSVAAPTAGLHFTDRVLDDLRAKKVELLFATLHVGAGTFKPVESEFAHLHDMHSEWVEVDLPLIQSLASSTSVTCVGTTSLRSVESLFWYAYAAVHAGCLPGDEYCLPQFYPYETSTTVSHRQLFATFIQMMEDAGKKQIRFKTALMIIPGYTFRVASRLITNFHQPRSTLLMLVDAFTHGSWKLLYDYALAHDYRFLSYGDGCLIELPS